jgi:hypothetical protein
MSLLFIDSCGDHYASADISKKWNSVGSGASIVSGGRYGNRFRMTSTAPYVTKTLDAASGTLIVGVAFQASALGEDIIIQLLDVGMPQISLYLQPDGTMRLYRRDVTYGTLLDTSVNAIFQDTWYYIELKVTIHNTTGSYELKVDGVTWFSGTGVDTDFTGTSGANRVSLGSTSSLGTVSFYYDDLYVCDGVDSGIASNPCNDFLGDVRIEALLPIGAGANGDWTRSAGADNYALVDESAPNDDTDYVYSQTPGQVDTYNFQNLSYSDGEVFGVQVLECVRKDDADDRSVAPVVRSGGTDYIGTPAPINNSYTYVRQVYQANPNGDVQWTITAVEDAEFGVDLSA